MVGIGVYRQQGTLINCSPGMNIVKVQTLWVGVDLKRDTVVNSRLQDLLHVKIRAFPAANQPA